MNQFLIWFVPYLIVLAVIIYAFSLLHRLVRAVEKIAERTGS